jgi:hypothetical protein
MKTKRLSTKELNVDTLDQFLTNNPAMVDIINWRRLFRRYRLPSSFIDKYIKKVRNEAKWYYICRFQKLTPAFIKKYEKDLDKHSGWFYISRYQNLDPEFIVNNLSKLNPVILENEHFKEWPESIQLLLIKTFQR